MQKCLIVIGFFCSLVMSIKADCKDIDLFDGLPAQARLFAGKTSVKPDAVNTELTAQNIKNMNNMLQFGLEITYAVLPRFDLGLRYSKHYACNFQNGSTLSNDYSGTFNEDSVMAIGRIPLVLGKIFRFDVFGAFGGSNTTFTLKSAAEDGQLTRKNNNGWLASPYSAYGASAGIGFKHFFFTIEGGYENNKIDHLNRSGNITNNITSLNMSGSYIMVGFLFDGVKVTKE